MLRFDPADAPLGAFVENLDPDAIRANDVDALRQALFDFGLLIVRGEVIEPAQLVSIGRAFGELEILPEPDKRHPDHPEIFNLTNALLPKAGPKNKE